MAEIRRGGKNKSGCRIRMVGSNELMEEDHQAQRDGCICHVHYKIIISYCFPFSHAHLFFFLLYYYYSKHFLFLGIAPAI